MLREASLILLGVSIHKAITFITRSLNRNQAVVSDDGDVDSIPTVSSLHHAAPPPAIKYDVFLSFRGEDTRDTFSSYLYEALCKANVQTFMDHKLHKGDDISPILLKTIEESEISLIIFSKDYASSTWCMDELVHIMKCRGEYGRIVIPIFYHVDPSNIRKQNGSFGDGFAKLKLRFKHNQEKVQQWKDALIHSTKLSGWDSKNIRPESKLIKKIVKDILSKLNSKSSFHAEALVGIDRQVRKIEELLNEVRIVGIWGMAGIGKPTLARAVFHKLKEHFEASSFVGNVREQLARIGLDELQKKCLKELLKDEDLNTYNLKSTFVKSRLHRKKILLILDDVDNFIAIEDLIKVCEWFGEGSKIIITSRDMQVLKNTSVSRPYHVPQLDSLQSLHLFSLKAFKHNKPSKSYLELSKWVVDYCEGNPLALTVLGCFLHGRGEEEWESAMKKLNQTPHQDIFDVLKLSFDGLDDTQKNVFLDLALFLNEAWSVSLEDCTGCIYDSSALIEISVLKERSLISVNDRGYIEMHALLIDMGLEISRQQLISNPERPIRLWRHKDIYQFFNKDKGVESIRCLSLDLSEINRTAWWVTNFGKMHNLIFLNVYKWPSKLTICGDLDYLPEELRFFGWRECPFAQVPLHFCSENLVKLIMVNSNIRQLWNGNQHFPNLKEINVRGSRHLTTLPDLSQAPKIKCVDVNGCVNLDQIHASTIPSNLRYLPVDGDGPRQINLNFGGSMKGTRSGLIIGFNYLDPNKLAFHKIRIKVLVCGNMICGVRFKHVKMILEERYAVELRNLLPFAWIVEYLEAPTEYWHDFKQHYDYEYRLHGLGWVLTGIVLELMNRRGGRGERHMVMKDDYEEKEEEVVAKPTLMEVERNEEEDDEEVMIEYPWTNNTFITRIPQSITRWLLLKELRLRESDIIKVEDSSISKSLFPFSHTSCNTIFDRTVSFPIPPSTFTHPHHLRTSVHLASFFIDYGYNCGALEGVKAAYISIDF